MSRLIFDFDSTLVSVEALDELFASSIEGKPDRETRVAEFREITDLGMAGELPAAVSLSRRLSVLQTTRPLVELVGARIARRLTPSVERHADFFRREAHRIYVLSGGFEELIRPALERLGLSKERLLAHRFQYDSEENVVGLDLGTPMARGGKPEAFRSIGSTDGEVWMVGDGATDLELRTLGLVDRFVAFTENRYREGVVASADAAVGSMDDLLELLDET
jgi:D-3-phosphoglycerate dehydrogenase